MNNQSNVRLCRAVQQQSCLYDHAVANSATRETYDRAWLEVAKMCEESVGACKQRWRTILNTFARSLITSPKKRKGNRGRENNLHDVLEFLIPHLKDGAEALLFGVSNDEAGGVMTVIEKKAQENAEELNKAAADDGLLEEPAIKHEVEESKSVNINENDLSEEASTENDKTDISGKRPPSARLKVLRKTSEDVKVTQAKVGGKTQSLEKTDEDVEEEDPEILIEDRLSKNVQISKSKVGTFYISPTASDTGTFYIQKNSDSNELEDITVIEENETNEDNVLYECELNESTQPNSKVEDPIKTRHNRLRRACKRGLAKKTLTQRDLRQKDTTAKGMKRYATRMKSLGVATRQLIADTKLAMTARNTAPVENQSNTKTRTLCIPQGDTIKGGSQQKKSLSPVIKLARYDANSSTHTHVEQGIQCNLQSTSSDDDFFDTLKPYLSEMNARQKLHFKKKIFESLMEVFDSTSDFPANDESKAIVPKQLSAVSTDELQLVRELVAMVQAAKHTPELNLNLSSGSGSELVEKKSAEKCAMISPTVVSCSTQPAPPLSLRVTPFNATATTANSTSNSSKTSPLSCGVATSTQTTAASPASPLLQRRVIRKLVKVNELGATSACNLPNAASNSELLHRRVYRIFPKSGVNNASLENAVNASNVGTFIVPRSSAEATVHREMAGSSNRKVIASSSASPVGLVSATVKAGRNLPTIRVGARPLVRRYSVCGALQNFDTASKNYLTTTANAKETASSTPKITIAHRCSPANVASREVFKLPTPFRSSISSVNAIVSSVATHTTTSRTKPLVSVSAGDRSSAVRTGIVNMGFNKYARNDEKTTTASSPKSYSNAKARRDSSSSSHVVGNKRSLGTSAEIAGKRNRSVSEKRVEEEAVGVDAADLSVIASDEFDILNIKTEPADDGN